MSGGGSQTPVFVLSSGRTGSTFLAKMINRHPELLCVSDLFEPVGSVPYFDRDRSVDGAAFFEVLSAPSFPQRTAYWRKQPNAELLFLHPDDDMVSLLLSYTLPFLTDGPPLALYEELRKAVVGWPKRPMPEHLIHLFDWLRDRFGRRLWVERTGGSLPHTREIVSLWPDAKIVHNFRDCRETAISMMTGSFFRLYLELEKDPDLGDWDDTVMPPIEEMGAMLDRWIVDAVDALETVPAAQRIDLSYEQLVSDPTDTLLRFACFVLDRETPTAEDRAWSERESARVRPASLKFPRLSADEQSRLTKACGRGLSLLGYS